MFGLAARIHMMMKGISGYTACMQKSFKIRKIFSRHKYSFVINDEAERTVCHSIVMDVQTYVFDNRRIRFMYKVYALHKQTDVMFISSTMFGFNITYIYFSNEISHFKQ